MSTPQNNPDPGLRRPGNALSAVLPDQAAVEAATAKLADLGVDPGDLAALHGAEGIRNFDLEGDHHGGIRRLVRSWTVMGGADANVLFAYQEALEQGHVLLLVPADDADAAATRAEILKRHGGADISYFHGGAMQSMG